MDETQRKLLNIVSCHLFSGNSEIELNNEIIEEAKRQAVWGLIDAKAYQEFASNITVQYGHALLSKYLEDIPFTTIKGYASAYYYPFPNRRTMGDIDFLVDEKNHDVVEKKLIEAGFILEHITHIHRCYRKGKLLFEMHSKVNGIPENKKKQDINELMADTIDTARTIIISGNNKIIIPDDFHNGLICLLHIMSHMKNTGIGLRHFCDWACLVNSVSEFDALFKERFEKIGLWKCAQLFSLAAVKYLGLPYREWMGTIDEPILEMLMDEIMMSGNFGKAKETKTVNWFFDKKYAKSKFLGFVMKLNKTVHTNWPIAKKIPLFYPIGYIFFSVKYIVQILNKERNPIQLGKAMRLADKKNKLIREMNLFE